MSDEDDLVKVRVLFRPAEDMPHSENLWAAPVDAHDGGGTYRLENHAFFVPMAAGDVVRAELDGHGQLQVVDVVQPSRSLVTTVEVDRAASEETVQVALERWAHSGATWSEGSAGFLTTSWETWMTQDQITDVIGPDIDSDLVQPAYIATPDERTREALADEVDFELDRTPPEAVTTDYWAGDDPAWAELGRDAPDFLAFVQRLASEDARVARALEKGQHDRVLLFIERITAEDPRTLPPLDGPIFDE